MIGTVKWYNETKGFGFIAPEGGTKDVFVHVTAVRASNITLTEGMRVEFDVDAGKDGRKAAVNLRKVGAAG